MEALSTAVAGVHGESQIRLKIVNALSGNVLGEVCADPLWTCLRLKVEIYHVLRICTKEQRLFLDEAMNVLPDDAILGEVSSLLDIGTIKLLRLPSGAKCRAPRNMVIEKFDSAARVSWIVDAKMLSTNAGNLTSPFFDLDFGGGLQLASFKLTLYTTQSVSLKRTDGKGHIQLKRDQDFSETVDISVSIGNSSHSMISIGPFAHNFATHSLWRSSCCTSAHVKENGFDFKKAAGKSKSFSVCVTITLRNNPGEIQV